MIKDSIVNLKKSLRMTLQNVPAVVDTLIRGLDEVDEEISAGEVYSADEHVVGTWLDGSKIYEKTVDFGALPDSGSKVVSHGITGMNKLISLNAIASSSYIRIALPYIYGTKTETEFVNIYTDSNNITIYCTGDRSSYNGVVTLRYTKTITSRSPENDTKNGGEDEPDVKTVDEPVEDLNK